MPLARATAQSRVVSPRTSPTANACSSAASRVFSTRAAMAPLIAARTPSIQRPTWRRRLPGSSRTYPVATMPRSSALRSLSAPPGFIRPRGRLSRTTSSQRLHGDRDGASSYQFTRTRPCSGRLRSPNAAVSIDNRKPVASSRADGRSTTRPTTRTSMPSSSRGRRASIATPPRQQAHATPKRHHASHRPRGTTRMINREPAARAAQDQRGGNIGSHCTSNTPINSMTPGATAPSLRTRIPFQRKESA